MYQSIKDFNKHFKIKTVKKGMVGNDESSPLREALDSAFTSYGHIVIKPERYENPREDAIRELCNIIRGAASQLVELGVDDPEPIIDALVKADIKGKKRGQYGQIVKDGFVPADLKGLY